MPDLTPAGVPYVVGSDALIDYPATSRQLADVVDANGPGHPMAAWGAGPETGVPIAQGLNQQATARAWRLQWGVKTAGMEDNRTDAAGNPTTWFTAPEAGLYELSLYLVCGIITVPDAGTVAHTVEASADGGDNWTVLAEDIYGMTPWGSHHSISGLAMLPAGGKMRSVTGIEWGTAGNGLYGFYCPSITFRRVSPVYVQPTLAERAPEPTLLPAPLRIRPASFDA